MHYAAFLSDGEQETLGFLIPKDEGDIVVSLGEVSTEWPRDKFIELIQALSETLAGGKPPKDAIDLTPDFEFWQKCFELQINPYPEKT